MASEQNKKIRKQINKVKLPRDKPVLFVNEDKASHEKWLPGRHLLNFPAPWRAIICGPPNSGKTFWGLQLVLFQGCDTKIKGANNPFEKIIVVHCSKHSKEYDIIGAEVVEEVPAPNTFDGSKKTLVILEDLSLIDMAKDQRNAVKRLFAFVSTHCNVCVYCTIQTFFSAPKIMKECADLFILFPSIDNTSLQMISKKVGMDKDMMRTLFDKFCTNTHDNIFIDNTGNGLSPSKLRYNGFKTITMKDSGTQQEQNLIGS